MTEPAASPVPGLPLRSNRLLVRAFRSSDFRDVHAYASDPEVTRYLRFGPNRRRDTARFLRDSIAGLAEPEPSAYHLGIVERATGRVCGGLGLIRRRPELIEVGYCLARPVWGQGYATEALREAVRFAGRRFPGATLFGLVLPQNAASVRVLLRCGFAAARDSSPFAPWMTKSCAGSRAYQLPPRRIAASSPGGGR